MTTTPDADDGIVPGTRLTYRQMCRSLNQHISQEAIEDAADVDKLLPSLSTDAKHELGRAVLRLSQSTREQFINALKGMRS